MPLRTKGSQCEVFQRHNVMVHNNGIVHHSYLTKVPESLRAGIKAGQKENFGNAKGTFAPRLVQLRSTSHLSPPNSGRSLSRKTRSARTFSTTITMKALFAERYEVAAGASRFLMEDRQLPEKWLLYARLNYWQTQKWSGKFDDVKDEIQRADFTAKDDLIQLARFVLLEAFDEALPLLETTLQGKKLRLKDLEEWPIFQQFRKDERVKALIAIEVAKTSATLQLTPDELKSSDNAGALAVTAASKETIN